MSARLRSLFVTALVACAALPADAQQAGIDVTRYQFDVRLPERGDVVAVTSTVEFTRRPDVTSIRLDLLAPMRVQRATVGCGVRARRVRVVRDRDAVTLPLPRPSTRHVASSSISPAEAVASCVAVSYAGMPRDGLIITTDDQQRWRAFADHWPNRARHWLATVDHPSDKALVAFNVDAPADREVIANGTRVDVVASRPGRQRTRWATRDPLPTYLMVIAAGPLSVTPLGDTACGFARAGGCVPQAVYTQPEVAEHMPGAFSQAGDVVAFFAQTVGAFPFEQLLHVQSSTRFGGMENAGAIFYAERLFSRPGGVSVGLIAHETAHQWFGDAVTARAWPHVWLSEGFATYFGALYTEHDQGRVAFIDSMRRIRQSIAASPVVAQRAVIDEAETDLMKLLNANSYQKGAFVLHMLRAELGDARFFASIRRYYTTHHYGTALTRDLLSAIEAESGQAFGWFFEQWLQRPGIAALSTTWRHDPEARTILFTVAQQNGRPAYRLTLRVDVVQADGTVVTHRLPVMAQDTTSFTIPWAGGVPSAIRIDPDAEVLAVFEEMPTSTPGIR